MPFGDSVVVRGLSSGGAVTIRSGEEFGDVVDVARGSFEDAPGMEAVVFRRVRDGGALASSFRYFWRTARWIGTPCAVSCSAIAWSV